MALFGHHVRWREGELLAGHGCRVSVELSTLQKSCWRDLSGSLVCRSCCSLVWLTLLHNFCIIVSFLLDTCSDIHCRSLILYGTYDMASVSNR